MFTERSRLSQGSLGLFYQQSKHGFIVNSQIGQDLTVDLDSSLLQTRNKAAVGQTVQTRTGVDTGNPQGTELTLTLTTVTVRVLTGLGYRLLSNAEHTTAGTVVTFSQLQNLLMATTSNYTTFYTSHGFLLIK